MASASGKVNTVLVIGASRNVGRPTMKPLAAKGFQVSGLTRDSSQARLPAEVRHLRTDYSLVSRESIQRPRCRRQYGGVHKKGVRR